MIRLLIIAFVVVLIWLLVMQLVRAAKKKKIDWTGVAFAAGFVALAFWLRSATGMG